ncbi:MULTISPECIES: HlyD family type I secretion periplasmic adaptor subunit [unclassified Maridesulfovibrio]|uniref:HlyD family type I secretion periplasmic adaptor subunit n=1 Tax=unclassified Maridesulfovibrio TaxID=2794999 RepID=UPI003B402079
MNESNKEIMPLPQRIKKMIQFTKAGLNQCFGFMRLAPKSVCDGIHCYKNRYRSKEAEYLSGIDAVVNAPLPTIAWLLPVAIMGLISVAILWATFSQIDIISPATGKTIPSGRVKVIQAPELCVIKEVLVQEGQSVEAGQTLIAFDQTEVEGDALDISNQLDRQYARRARLAVLSESDDSVGDFMEPAGVPQFLVEAERRIMYSQWDSFCAEMATLDQEIAGKEAEYEETLAQLEKIRSMVGFAERRVERLEKLFQEKAVSRSGLEEMEEQLVERRQSESVLTQTAKKIETEIGYAVEQRRTAAEKFHHSILTELSECEQQIVTLEQDLHAVQRRLAMRTLKSPIKGTVLDLAVHTKEGVVEPASVLMRIVPNESHLEVEAKILNRDIGFVSPGQKVKVKVETFEFTKYGAINGIIRKIANDVTMDEQLGPVYRALIEMERDTIKVGDKPIRLIPGMSVTVDVNLGSRRLIEYLLTPVLRYKNEALRER